jgi:predicted acyltransferase
MPPKYSINIARTAIASANIKAIIIAKSILLEADGFRPTALMAECPTIPMTIAGLIVVNNNMSTVTEVILREPLSL